MPATTDGKGQPVAAGLAQPEATGSGDSQSSTEGHGRMNATTWTATIGGLPLRVWVEQDDSGRVVEIRAAYGKEHSGSGFAAVLGLVCASWSIALRAGMPLRRLVETFTGTKFSPKHETGDESQPRCMSVVDYLARSLGNRFPEAMAEPLWPVEKAAEYMPPGPAHQAESEVA